MDWLSEGQFPACNPISDSSVTLKTITLCRILLTSSAKERGALDLIIPIVSSQRKGASINYSVLSAHVCLCACLGTSMCVCVTHLHKHSIKSQITVKAPPFKIAPFVLVSMRAFIKTL